MSNKQYKELGLRILNEGKWVVNPRTGVRCLTVINADFTYDVANNKVPMDTLAWHGIKWSTAEMLGYMRGLNTATAFEELGTPTWWANADNWEHGQFKGDMGLVYGAVGNNWPVMEKVHGWKADTLAHTGGSIDLLNSIYQDLCNGIDNRGEIWTFWNPGMFHLGCLRPCMYSHHFSILDGTLYLNSTQRSCDYTTGVRTANMMQCYMILKVMAQITGLKPGEVYHKMVNVHMYEDQVELAKELLSREELDCEELELWINPEIKTLEDLRTWVTPADFKITGYNAHEKMTFPFTT